MAAGRYFHPIAVKPHPETQAQAKQQPAPFLLGGVKYISFLHQPSCLVVIMSSMKLKHKSPASRAGLLFKQKMCNATVW